MFYFFLLLTWVCACMCVCGGGGYNHLPLSASEQSCKENRACPSNWEVGPSKYLRSWFGSCKSWMHVENQLDSWMWKAGTGNKKLRKCYQSHTSLENQWSPNDVFTYTYICLSCPQVMHTLIYKIAIFDFNYLKIHINFCFKFLFELQGTLHLSW